MMKGTITISRMSPSHGDAYMRIDIDDKTSGIGFLRINITLNDLMMALTGRAMSPMEFEVSGLELVGMICEDKTIRIAVPERGIQPAALMTLAAPYQVDGWAAVIRGDARIDVQETKGILWVNVRFIRYVKAEEGA
jgi:hypothetical protein